MSSAPRWGVFRMVYADGRPCTRDLYVALRINDVGKCVAPGYPEYANQTSVERCSTGKIAELRAASRSGEIPE